MKTFDIISDEVQGLFDIKNENIIYNGKVSLLKGNRKILLCLDENIYYIKYLSNIDKILFLEFIIIFNSGKNEGKKANKRYCKIKYLCLDEKNDFNQNEKQFKIIKCKISFDIKQKINNYFNPDISFDVKRDCYKNAYKYVSFNKVRFSFANSFFNNNSNYNFLSSFFREIQNFRIIQKYDQTTNVCSIMRCLSLIQPFDDYFTSRLK